jgi:hypothetical protein
MQRRNLVDLACAVAFALAGAAVSHWAFGQLDVGLYRKDGIDIWFAADQPRTLANMELAGSDHYRTSVHPIFSILMYPLFHLASVFGLDHIAAARALVVSAAALTAALFFYAMRSLGLPVVVAALFSAILISSATFLHWFAIVETYPFSALSIVIMLNALIWWPADRRAAWVAASGFTLAVTVTNWMFGLAATYFRFPFSSFVRISSIALVLVAVLAIAQKLIFPTSALFFNPRKVASEYQWMQVTEEIKGTGHWTPVSNVSSFLLYGAVVPAPMIKRIDEKVTIVQNQDAPVTDNTWAGIIATAAWVLLLTGGIWGALISQGKRPIAAALGVFLAGQLVLHLVYGSVTFLYAAHFFPALLALSAFGWFSPLRRLILVAGAAIVVLGGYSNLVQFKAAADLSAEILLSK